MNSFIGIVLYAESQTALIKRAIESILNQSYINWQLVIIDDNNNEMLEKILSFHQNKCQNKIRIIRNTKPSGIGNAINLGLSCLDTDLAVIYKDNDSWSPDFLLRMIQTYITQKRKFPNVGGIFCHINKVTEVVEGNIIRVKKVENFNQSLNTGFLSLNSLLDHNQFVQTGFIFELEVCKDLGLYDEQLPILYDWDFYIRFILKRDIWVLGETLVFFHQLDCSDNGYSMKNHKEYHLYKTYLENKWLRQSLNSGKINISLLSTLISIPNNNFSEE